MFPFSRDKQDPQPEPQAAARPAPEAHPLDALTGGVFSAATSGERAQRLRDWLATEPAFEHMQEVFKDLSAKDKGAAKALREKLDELRRAKGQEAVAAEWQAKAEALLQSVRLNIADAMAWQRDAAKAGAPLSREPLSVLRTQLVERIKKVEDLQQQVMVQREAAVLLAQRIELLSTKSWHDAQAQQSALQADVEQWRQHARQLLADPQWLSVDVRFPPQLEAAQNQLDAVWTAFDAAVAQAAAAAADPAAPLPSVPVWADELRVARGEAPAAGAAEPAAAVEKPARPAIDPEQRAAAQKAIEAGTMLLEQAVTAGHSKNMNSAAQALRQALKKHGRLIDDALEARVNAALVSAGELEGWQRWSADKLREQLVARAEALLVRRKSHRAAADVAANAEANAPTAVTQQAAQAAGYAAEVRPAAAQPEAAADEADMAANAQANEAAQATLDAGQAEAKAAAAPAPTPESTTESTAETANAQANEATEVTQEAAALQASAAAPVAAAAPVEAAAPAGEATAANALANEPAEATAQAGRRQAEAEAAAADAGELVPAMGGRKLQEAIRKLREEWKAADQGGAPNHALWKRFDRAINAAHKHVEVWLTQVRAQSAEHKAQRQALIDEVKAWGQAQAGQAELDWKAFNRQIHQFSDRWRNAGHLSEKAFGELQARWKEAIHAAAAPLEAAQKASTVRRQALIAEAEELGRAAQLRIDAVKALQQRWQAEAQAVPLDRKFEQKLWDAFRKPIDEAFNRKGAAREQQQAAMSEHDKAVLDAAKALEAANASGDGQRIREAMAQLEAAMRAQPAAASISVPKTAKAGTTPAPDAINSEAGEGAETPAAEAAAPAAPPKPAKPLVAMRGDDRPGARKAEPAPAGRGGKFGDRARSGPGGERRDGGRFGDRQGTGRDGGRFGDRPSREERGPRLGDAAFRAQRDAVEHAQAQLRKLAAQAHGEALAQLLGAWQQRQPDQVPSVQELGRGVTPAVRGSWTKAIGAAAAGGDRAREALLRLEMAAEVPTPADQLDARRALQLQLLTRRNEPGPRDTWAADTATVLASGYDDGAARRLQNALKALVRK